MHFAGAQVNLACVKAEQFRCAEIAGQHIIARLLGF